MIDCLFFYRICNYILQSPRSLLDLQQDLQLWLLNGYSCVLLIINYEESQTKAAFTCCVFILKSFLFSRCSLGVMLICHISSGFRASAEDTIKRTGLQSCSSLKMKQMLLQKCKMWANLAFQYLQCSLCITNISPVLQGRRCASDLTM